MGTLSLINIIKTKFYQLNLLLDSDIDISNNYNYGSPLPNAVTDIVKNLNIDEVVLVFDKNVGMYTHSVVIHILIVNRIDCCQCGENNKCTGP